MYFKSRFLFAFGLCFLPGMLRAEAVLGRFDGSSLTGPQRAAVKQLIQSEMLKYPNAAGTMEVTLVKLDAAYLVSFIHRRADASIRSEQQKISSLDEMDVAIGRLVAALLGDVPFEDTAERGKVLQHETKEPSRVKSIGGFEAYFGAAWPFTNAMRSQQTMYDFGVGYSWDIRWFLLELAGHFQVGYNDIDMGVINIGIGLQRILFGNRSTALYVGPDFGFASVHDTQNGSKSGFGIGGNVGALFFRQADTNLDLRFRLMMVTEKLNSELPVTGSLSVGIRF